MGGRWELLGKLGIDSLQNWNSVAGCNHQIDKRRPPELNLAHYAALTLRSIKAQGVQTQISNCRAEEETYRSIFETLSQEGKSILFISLDKNKDDFDLVCCHTVCAVREYMWQIML